LDRTPKRREGGPQSHKNYRCTEDKKAGILDKSLKEGEESAYFGARKIIEIQGNHKKQILGVSFFMINSG
jgi:hypothetical protein